MLRKLVSRLMLWGLALVIVAALSALSMSPADSRAQVIGKDKYQHAAVSAALGAAARLQTNDPWKAWALAMGPGLAKELLDARKGGTGFSVRDLLADGIGAYVGVRVGGLLLSPRYLNYSRSF